MQGIFIAGSRPKTKKAIREAIASGKRVSLEGTSMLGNEYSGPVSDAPDGIYYFVGPCPYTARKFYGQIVKNGAAVKVV